MQLTALQAQDMNLEGRLRALQEICRDGTAPVFPVDGMQLLPTLPRKGSMQAGRKDKAYVGGEKFRPSELVIEHHMIQDSITVSMVLQPAKLSLVAEVANVRLPLDRAMEVFVGMADWVTSIEPIFKPQPVAGVPDVPVVTKEEFANDDRRGAW